MSLSTDGALLEREGPSTPRLGPNVVSHRRLGTDSLTDLGRFVAIFVVFFGLDRATGRLSSLTQADTDTNVLVVQALQTNLLLAAVVGAVAVLGFFVRRSELLVGWSGLEHGTALNRMMIPAIILLVWRASTYDINFLVERWYAWDRILLVVLAIAAITRPIFVVPLAFQLRVLHQQFYYPIGLSPTANLADFTVMALLAVAAGHMLFVITRRRSTSPTLALLGTVIASHFFEPGRAKLPLGWLGNNRVGDFAEASHLVGWLGAGDGAFARRFADFADAVNTPLLIGTLIIELGAVVAVAHPKLLRVWLGAAIAMHSMVFVFTGYWFLDWIALELGLLVVLTVPGLSSWVNQNATPVRGLLCAAVVLLVGGRLFNPPPLAWLDSPVSYVYAMEGIGASGNRYSLAASEFAPYEEDLVFMQLEFAPRQAVAFGYGAIYSVDLLRELDAIDTFDELSDIESTYPATQPADRAKAEDFALRFLDHARGGRDRPRLLIAPPPLFWTQAPQPTPTPADPLVGLEVFRVTSIHNHPELGVRRELLLVVGVDQQGQAVIEERGPDES